MSPFPKRIRISFCLALPAMLCAATIHPTVAQTMFGTGDLDRMQSMINGLEGRASAPVDRCLSELPPNDRITACTQYIAQVQMRTPMSAPGVQAQSNALNQAYRSRGRAYGQLENWGPAIADLTDALRYDRRDSLALLLRGYDHERRGNREAAIADYQAFLALKPTDAKRLRVAQEGLARLGAQAQPQLAPHADQFPAPPPPAPLTGLQ